MICALSLSCKSFKKVIEWAKPTAMINLYGQIEINTIRLSLILSRDIRDEGFLLPNDEGGHEMIHIRFTGIEQERNIFIIAGEVNWNREDHPIHFKAVYNEKTKTTVLKYEIETELDGSDDDDSDAGEDWKNL